MLAAASACTSGGRSARSRLASLTHSGMLAGESQMTRLSTPVGLRQRVLHAQHAAPRLAQEVQPLEPQRAPHGVDLLDEQLDRPLAGIAGKGERPQPSWS